MVSGLSRWECRWMSGGACVAPWHATLGGAGRGGSAVLSKRIRRRRRLSARAQRPGRPMSGLAGTFRSLQHAARRCAALQWRSAMDHGVKSMTCSVGCPLDVSTVPPRRGRVVDWVSCRTATAGPIAELGPMAHPDRSGRAWIPVEGGRSPGSFDRARRAMPYVGKAGEAPRVLSAGRAAVMGRRWCTLSGREITLP